MLSIVSWVAFALSASATSASTGSEPAIIPLMLFTVFSAVCARWRAASALWWAWASDWAEVMIWF